MNKKILVAALVLVGQITAMKQALNKDTIVRKRDQAFLAVAGASIILKRWAGLGPRTLMPFAIGGAVTLQTVFDFRLRRLTNQQNEALRKLYASLKK